MEKFYYHLSHDILLVFNLYQQGKSYLTDGFTWPLPQLRTTGTVSQVKTHWFHTNITKVLLEANNTYILVTFK